MEASVAAGTVRVDGPYVLRDIEGRVLQEGGRLPWTQVDVSSSGVRLAGSEGFHSDGVTLEPGEPGTLHWAALENGQQQPTRQYAGSLLFIPSDDQSFHVINALDVETYVAGVVPNEVWPDFHDESLKAQAIAARSYVLYIMCQRADETYDVRATEGDQVYRGMRRDEFGRRVQAAVEATTGLVLAWDAPAGERAFCTFYSAACGGLSQSLAEVQEIRPEDVPVPLRGGVRCDFCSIAKGEAYRWGPVAITKEELLQKLQERNREMQEWERIESVVVTRRTPGGRMGTVTVIGPRGQSVEILGERFRLAIGSRVVRSTDCEILDLGDEIRFVDGRGFGHGVGLCQWGMEGQARKGARAGEILRFYYPESKIVRAY